MQNQGKGLGLGILLLTIGVLWALGIAGIVNMSTLFALFKLWPLILVAIGIGFIFRNNRLIKATAWLVILAVIVCYGYFKIPSKGSFIVDGSKVTTSAVTLEKRPETERGELKLEFGATQLNLDADTTNLLDAKISEELVRHSEVQKDGNRITSIRFWMKGYTISNFNHTETLRNDFHLNRDVIWKLTLDTGAIEGNLDMKDLKVEELDINTGASKLQLDMGSCNTSLKLDAGATKIAITLPKDTGIRVRLDGALNDTNFDEPGWEKKGDWRYSPGYDTKSFKIEADVDMGVGKLTVVER
ncbi:MAG: hypothetical protein ABFD25_21290 [Clostridiaceae bacterium]